MSDEEDIEGSGQNDQLICICGYSGEGKSASLKDIPDQEDWAYLNCEAGKRLPFKNKFEQFRIEDPYQVHEAFDHFTTGEGMGTKKGIIVDTITFMMDMFETQHVLGSADTMKGWSNYAQFFKRLMQQKVTAFNLPVIMLAHVLDTLDERAMEMRVSIPVKGSLKNQGIEAYFSTVVMAKKIPVKELKDFENDLLIITDDEKELGYKHVFQTRPTKTTVGTRIRSPMGMFTKKQTFMDNNAAMLLRHLEDFYKH